MRRLVVTAPLAGLAMLVSTAVALPLGLLAASKRGRPADYGVMAFSQLGVAVPNFWFGILLVLWFSIVDVSEETVIWSNKELLVGTRDNGPSFRSNSRINNSDVNRPRRKRLVSRE